MNLDYFLNAPFYDALHRFFSDLNIPMNPITEAPGNPQDILSATFTPNNRAHQMMGDVYFVGMVSEEAFTRRQSTTYAAVAMDIKTKDYDGLLLFGVTLKQSDRFPTRTQLADITRAFNREFNYTPVVVIFKYGETISFANCERLAYKQSWREGEKAGKVSLLKDISCRSPHTGHLKILQSLEIARSGRNAITTFADLFTGTPNCSGKTTPLKPSSPPFPSSTAVCSIASTTGTKPPRRCRLTAFPTIRRTPRGSRCRIRSSLVPPSSI
jgi:hypothetical protein